MSNGPTLTLCSQGLLSKWGFGDGDTPGALLDYWDDQGVDYSVIDWRVVLRKLVRAHLLPLLAQHHEIELVDIETNHNPIRAFRVDGVEVDDMVDIDQCELQPESVDVPYVAIAATCGLAAPEFDT